MLAAVIFDFDGIIVDTEPIHYRSFQVLLEPLGLGYSWEEYTERYMGYDDRDAFKEAFRSGCRELDGDALEELIALKAKLFQDVVAEGVTPYPGVVELVTSLAVELPVAICSGALRSDVDPILSLLSLDKAFSVKVTAEEVPASKPDPACYTLAVQRLSMAFPGRGIAPSSCVAIEDTPAGISSASRAGISVLAVTNSYPEAQLVGASSIVRSLADISLADLKALIPSG